MARFKTWRFHLMYVLYVAEKFQGRQGNVTENSSGENSKFSIRSTLKPEKLELFQKTQKVQTVYVGNLFIKLSAKKLR